MSRYTTRPVAVEAVQWNAHGDHAAVTLFTNGLIIHRSDDCQKCGKSLREHGWLTTSDQRVCPGGYIVTSGGETSYVSAADFAARYVAVEETPAIGAQGAVCLFPDQDPVYLRDCIADLETRLFQSSREWYGDRESRNHPMPTDAEIWAEVRAGSPLARNPAEELAALTAVARMVLKNWGVEPDSRDTTSAMITLEDVLDAQSGGGGWWHEMSSPMAVCHSGGIALRYRCGVA